MNNWQFTVSDAIRNPDVKKLLESFIDINQLKRDITKTRFETSFLSSSIIGTVVEQYILINQYKNMENVLIERDILKYQSIIKEFLEGLKNKESKRITHYSNSLNLLTDRIVVFYQLFELENDALYKVVSRGAKSEKVYPYNFIDGIQLYEFENVNGNYFIDYNILSKLIENCFNFLLTDVYSKKKISGIQLLKLLYFQNLIIQLPYYLIIGGGGYSDSIFYNIKKIFFNYDEEIKQLHNVLSKNIEFINKIEILDSYQVSCSFEEIRGRIDFLSENSIIELKTGKKLTRNDLLQMFLYMLIVTASDDESFDKVKYLKLYYPLQNIKESYEIEQIISQLSQPPEFILRKVIKILSDCRNKFFLKLDDIRIS